MLHLKIKMIIILKYFFLLYDSYFNVEENLDRIKQNDWTK